MGDALADQATYLLDTGKDYPFDGPSCGVPRRFECNFIGPGLYEVYDTVLSYAATVHERMPGISRAPRCI